MKFKQWCSQCNKRVEVETKANKIEVVTCPNCGRPLMPCPICHGKMDTRDLGCNRGCSLKNDYIDKSKNFEKTHNL